MGFVVLPPFISLNLRTYSSHDKHLSDRVLSPRSYVMHLSEEVEDDAAFQLGSPRLLIRGRCHSRLHRHKAFRKGMLIAQASPKRYIDCKTDGLRGMYCKGSQGLASQVAGTLTTLLVLH